MSLQIRSVSPNSTTIAKVGAYHTIKILHAGRLDQNRQTSNAAALPGGYPWSTTHESNSDLAIVTLIGTGYLAGERDAFDENVTAVANCAAVVKDSYGQVDLQEEYCQADEAEVRAQKGSRTPEHEHASLWNALDLPKLLSEIQGRLLSLLCPICHHSLQQYR